MPSMSNNADVTAPKQQRVVGVPFRRGVSGNPRGRPVGSRSKLSESFLTDLRDCWARNGASALERCAQEQPDVLIKVIASLLPRDLRIDIGVDAASFGATFRHARAMLNPEPPRLRRPLPNQRVIEHQE
jgi:hypothetical protein